MLYYGIHCLANYEGSFLQLQHKVGKTPKQHRQTHTHRHTRTHTGDNKHTLAFRTHTGHRVWCDLNGKNNYLIAFAALIIAVIHHTASPLLR